MNRNDYTKIPDHIMNSMRQYCEEGKPTGSFLRAVFANDLKGAVCRADDTDMSLLPIYINWVLWIAPSACQGSYKKVKEWNGTGG